MTEEIRAVEFINWIYIYMISVFLNISNILLLF